MAPSESDKLSSISQEIILKYLESHGLNQTSKTFRRESGEIQGQEDESGKQVNQDHFQKSALPSLESLIVNYFKSNGQYSNLISTRREEEKVKNSNQFSNPISTTSTLKPQTKASCYKLLQTFDSIHTGNILFVKSIYLPVRSLNSDPDSESESEPESASRSPFKIQLTKCLVTTSADKTIVFFRPENGEILESFDVDGNLKSMPDGENESVDLVKGNSSAVLAMDQNPIMKRELAVCGMDGKIVFWDLLLRRPFFSLNHHSKFVTSVKFSPTGEYLASSSFDSKILIYRRKVTCNPTFKERSKSTAKTRKRFRIEIFEPEDPITGDLIPLNSGEIRVEYFKIHELNLNYIPESIEFVRCKLGFEDREEVWDRIKGGRDEFLRNNKSEIEGDGNASKEKDQKEDYCDIDLESGNAEERKRTWLCFTVKNDCHLHYLSFPLSADNPSRSKACLESSLERSNSDEVSNVEKEIKDFTLSEVSSKLIIPNPFQLISFNINPSPFDTHVSFSLTSLSLHPSAEYISVQTGNNSTLSTSSSTSSASTTISNHSKILIFPLLSGERVKTLFTNLEVSDYLNLKHVWNSEGDRIWLNSQDGALRCLDLNGEITSKINCHGIPSDGVDDQDKPGSNFALSNSWKAGRGGNTIVKDLVVWKDDEDHLRDDEQETIDDKGQKKEVHRSQLQRKEKVVSVGFDRTVRVVGM